MNTGYRHLVVWQKSMDLVLDIYKLTRQFPKSEIYGMTSQMRRAAVSIPSNIAEGSKRGTAKDYRNFLINAFASGAELETQIEIAKLLNWSEPDKFTSSEKLLDEVMRMLNKMTHTQLQQPRNLMTKA